MKIVYVGREAHARQALESENGDLLLLLYDRWDDYGYKTRFPTYCRIDNDEIELGAVRILFAGENASHPYLIRKQEEGWDGHFPLEDVDYISVPENITFYEQLLSLLPEDRALGAASELHDASYLAHINEDSEALALIDTGGFSTSLQRERSSQKSFADGWKLLNGQTLNVADLSFDFRNPLGELSALQLNFLSTSLLPHDINVIIGPNGVGKSWLVSQMVRAWIQPDEAHPILNGAGFRPRPNLSQLVAVSYSPFERLPVDTDDEASLEKSLKDKEVYHFFGFRGRHESQKTGKLMSVRHSLGIPLENAARSLVQCLIDDLRYSTLTGWANKLHTLQNIVGSAIQFDVAAVRLKDGAPVGEIVGDHPFQKAETVDVELSDGESALYLPIAPGASRINVAKLLEHVDLAGGVIFLHDNKPVPLSSGQRLFFYIVVNILGVIRRNSLVIVDEPELFLHPTLEVQFISMLKTILQAYGSKALLATHSVLTVREVPSACVHVFEIAEDEFLIKTPPFETFGGDVQRISSYVFGDRSVSKPYETWLRRLLEQHGDADAVIDALGDEMNEEIIVQLHAMEQGKW